VPFRGNDPNLRQVRLFLTGQALSLIYTPSRATFHEESGLDRIYIQAKRYTDTPVDRPQIHGFAGALLSKQGDRGVFITTSRFTKGAREEAERINARIELIDGARLAELLVQYGIGVQPEQSVTLYRLDEDFFDTL